MRKSKILVVDDDDDVRESLFDELCGEYEVDTVSSGEEALTTLKANSYDAVISDLRMPGLDGIAVLDGARREDPGMVRILLTGYLDERARQAMLRPDAPYKIGKPWHDEVEVALRRAFEHRDRERRLTSSVSDALAIAGIDDDLAGAATIEQIADILVRRAESVDGVDECAVVAGLDQSSVIAGESAVRESDFVDDGHWHLNIPLSTDGPIVFVANGVGATARDILQLLTERAKRWAQADHAAQLARHALANEGVRTEVNAMVRRAALGTMTAAVMHELASIVQALYGCLDELEEYIEDEIGRDSEALPTIEQASSSARRIMDLFRAMRTFVRSGEVAPRSRRVSDLVEHAITLVKSHFRGAVSLRVSEIPDCSVLVSEPLFLQVIVNLLRNAVEASPQGSTVDLEVSCVDGKVHFHVIDDGPGVDPLMVSGLFEPFSSSKSQTGLGLGLSTSAQIMDSHGGELTYERRAGRGACFHVVLDAEESM